MNVNTRVVELEPGWLLLRFQGDKPPAERRAFFLQRTLRDWLGDHPGRQVRRIVPIQDGGELLAVHVWVFAGPEKPKRKLPVQIHQQLQERLPAEHMEALLHYAYETFFSHEVRSAVLAVVSRGGNVVLFDRNGERCYVLPLSELRNLPAEALEKIKHWQSQPTTPYFTVELGGIALS